MVIRISFTTILCFLLLQGGYGQKEEKNNEKEINREFRINWPDDSLGYPESASDARLIQCFKNPPAGYGEVPFYWWVGDTLTKERLRWQLNKLHEAGVQGFSVSYPHGHPQSDPKIHQNGYGTFGMTYPSQPAIFSDEWWELWNWFTGECAKRGMGVGLDDYTLAVPGNHRWPDEIAALPKMRSYQGKLKYHNPITLQGGETKTFRISDSTISLTAFPVCKEGLEGNAAVNLLDNKAHKKYLSWTAPKDHTWKVIPVTTTSSFMLHPQHGKEVIRRYFQEFEKRVAPNNRKGLNYFFQDELTIDLGVDTWAEDFPEEFRRRKGYELRPYLAALHHDIGPKTVKVRIDYTDVLMDLAEERYFKPIYEWHRQRGLIYGCDNYGRGMNPTAYGDYFRATKWYTAPGNDAPQGDTALIQTKVSSSISHLYHRPRVWLEAYHSMGWDARPEQITEATDIHYLLGGNLLCLHGLYYTTHGSRWEWAPPDFHFRMPYWPHMKKWLQYVERLSYLLSQGQHVCDVAVLYPTTTLQAYPRTTPKSAFSMAKQLYEAGIDFDFIDHQSLAKASVENGRLKVAGESYRVLILGGMKAMRFASLQKTFEMYESGGLIIGTGAFPQASDRIGGKDPRVDAIVKEIFGYSAEELKNKGILYSINNPAEGTGAIISLNDTGKVENIIRASFIPDFLPDVGKGHKLHKRIGNRDVYMVMNVPGGTPCFFRSHGMVELWDAWTGETEALPILRKTKKGTFLRMPQSPSKASLIVFSPGEPEFEKTAGKHYHQKDTSIIKLTGKWESELVPTMNNQWGDYRLPPTETFIGPEAREMKHARSEQVTEGWQAKSFNASDWKQITCGFGPHMWKINIPAKTNPDVVLKALTHKRDSFSPVEVSGETYSWKPYEYSWRRGVKDQPGSQGYHGLKGKISDNFLIMGKAGHHLFGSYVKIPESTRIRVIKSGVEPYGIWIDGKKVTKGTVRLKKGFHPVIACYKNIKPAKEPAGPHIIDQRARAALVMVQKNAGKPPSYPLAMKWYKQPGRLIYDYLGGESTSGCYRFTTPPGLKEITFPVHGDVHAWVDGNEVPVHKDSIRKNGAGAYRVKLKEAVPGLSEIALRVEQDDGYYGGAVFPEYPKFSCTMGKIAAGDWSKKGVLKHYSGGMWYRKKIMLDPNRRSGKTILDLGKVVATCEVHVNGKKACILLSEPYTLDISDYVKSGENHLEILVYNTLSNHYQTIPTPDHYKKTTLSGLLGPVRLINIKK